MFFYAAKVVWFLLQPSTLLVLLLLAVSASAQTTSGSMSGTVVDAQDQVVPGADVIITSYSLLVREQERWTERRYHYLVLDEAQSLPYELLEEVRLLSNIETTDAKLLSVVLAGQPELSDRLNESRLRQLKQRIALRCELGLYDLAETAAYIAGRLRIAGGAPADIFTRNAVDAIFHGAGGVPRLVNVICENALIGGFAAQSRPVTRSIVEEILRDFDLRSHRAGEEPVNDPATDIRDLPPLPKPVPVNVIEPSTPAEDEPRPNPKMFATFGLRRGL